MDSARFKEAEDEFLETSIVRAREGSVSAVGQLLDHYRPYLLHTANAEIPSELAAKVAPSDVVQDACLQATRDFPQFRGRTEVELRAWLRRILLHNLKDVQKRFQATQKRDVAREVASPTISGRSDAVGSPVCPERSPSALAAARESLAALERAMAELDEDHRRAIQLRHFDRKSFKQIGEALGRSEDAARKLWGRAIDKLAEAMAIHDKPERSDAG